MTLPAELQVGRRAARPRPPAGPRGSGNGRDGWLLTTGSGLPAGYRKGPFGGLSHLLERADRRRGPAPRNVRVSALPEFGLANQERQTAGVPMSSATTKTKKTARDAYCPHCHLLIEKKAGKDWPKEPLRCPHCRLLVGTGRARPTPSAEPGARGSAAGVFAHEAKRAGADGGCLKKDDLPGDPRRGGKPSAPGPSAC